MQAKNQLITKNPIKKTFKNIYHFFSTYEKLWLITFVLLGFFTTFMVGESALYFAVLAAGLVMELTLAKRSRWSFVFVFLNSSGLIVIGALNGLYSEMIVNLMFWIPYAITGLVLWKKHLEDSEHSLAKVRSLTTRQTAALVAGVIVCAYGWSFVLAAWGDTQPLLDAFSTFLQLVTGVLILLRFKQQWLFWFFYILVSATIWILLGKWVMLIISFGYITNTIYGFLNWSTYVNKTHNQE